MVVIRWRGGNVKRMKDMCGTQGLAIELEWELDALTAQEKEFYLKSHFKH